MASCILWGSTTLIVSALLKQIPDSLVNKMPFQIDEDKKPNENDKLMNLYSK
jgi:hypothetical protein